MALFTSPLNFKTLFRFKNIIQNCSKNVYTKTTPLRITSSQAERIFEQNLKKMQECKDESSKFKFGYNIIEEIFSDPGTCGNFPYIVERNKELIEYNLDGGRHNRVKIFLNAYEKLAPQTKLSDKYLLQAYVMAGLVQLLVCTFNMVDDAIDDSKMRRKKPTWHRKAGRLTCNDTILLSTGVYTVMRNLFEKEPYYTPCLNILYELVWWASCSYGLDPNTIDILGRNVKYCNWDVLEIINTIQAGASAFQAPLFIVLHMAGYEFDNMKNDLMEVCALIGSILKNRNDYADRYSLSQGKTHDEDIGLGKLTWLILTALELSNPEQKKILQECYGKHDAACINTVINIYNELQLEDKFLKYEKELVSYTTARINMISDKKIHSILLYCLQNAVKWYEKY